MIAFPNAKINLGLNIIRKRADGYHDLETVFFPVGIRDALEIMPLEISADPGKEVKITQTGIPVEGSPGSNICVKAWQLLRKEHPDLPAIRMHLHKSVPTGAGLGGGSSDGAATLKLLDALFGLKISPERLAAYALALGSDCPFFLYNKPCFAGGQGEKLTPIQLDLSGYEMMIVHPGIHVSTAKAFAGVMPAIPETDIRQIISRPVTEWKHALVNDFEKTVFPAFPAIAGIKDALYDAGATYASMSGSGSSVFGIFPKGLMPELPFPEGHLVFRMDADDAISG
jgi:4-diphosphocytidyl-2-C-methyl-D-erythritol kinase